MMVDCVYVMDGDCIIVYLYVWVCVFFVIVDGVYGGWFDVFWVNELIFL